MKLKAYKAWTDSESGEWGRSLLGYVSADTEDACRLAAAEKFGCEYFRIRLFKIGERVKLHGYMSERSRAACLRAEFNAMSSDEQDAYMGI